MVIRLSTKCHDIGLEYFDLLYGELSMRAILSSQFLKGPCQFFVVVVDKLLCSEHSCSSFNVGISHS